MQTERILTASRMLSCYTCNNSLFGETRRLFLMRIKLYTEEIIYVKGLKIFLKLSSGNDFIQSEVHHWDQLYFPTASIKDPLALPDFGISNRLIRLKESIKEKDLSLKLVLDKLKELDLYLLVSLPSNVVVDSLLEEVKFILGTFKRSQPVNNQVVDGVVIELVLPVPKILLFDSSIWEAVDD